MKTDLILEEIRQKIENLSQQSKLEDTGVVTEVGDGVAKIYGLAKAKSLEMIEGTKKKKLLFLFIPIRSHPGENRSSIIEAMRKDSHFRL